MFPLHYYVGIRAYLVNIKPWHCRKLWETFWKQLLNVFTKRTTVSGSKLEMLVILIDCMCFFSLASRQKLHFAISQGVKEVKKLFEFLSVNFCIGGNFLRGVATPPPTQPISSYSPRAKSPRGLTPSGSTLSFTRIADTKHKCEQFYIFILLSIGYD